MTMVRREYVSPPEEVIKRRYKLREDLNALGRITGRLGRFADYQKMIDLSASIAASAQFLKDYNYPEGTE